MSYNTEHYLTNGNKAFQESFNRVTQSLLDGTLTGVSLNTPTITTPSINTGGTWTDSPTIETPIIKCPVIERENPSGSPTAFLRCYANGSATSPAYISHLHSQGTKASPSPTQNNNYCGFIPFWGYGTGGFDGGYSAYILAQALENFAGTSNRAMGLEFGVRAAGDASSNPVFHLRKTQATFGSTEGTGSIAVKMGAMTATTGTFSGAVSGVTSLSMSGALSGGTTISCSSSITGNGIYYGNNANNYLDMNTSGNSILYSRGSVAAMVDNDNNSTSNAFFVYNNGSTSDIQLQVKENEVTFYGVPFPTSDATINLGKSGNRWKDIYASNGTIQTSDIRQKDLYDQSPIDYLDFVKNLDVECGKWKDEIIPEQVETYYEQKFDIEEVEKTEIEFSDGTWQEVKYIEKIKKPVYSWQEITDSEGNKRVELLPVYEQKIRITESKTITHDRTHFWFVAQQIKEYLDSKNIDTINFAPLIIDKETDNYGLRYQQFIPIITKVIQDLIIRIENLEGK